ncbi:MAG: hypothetical protein FWF28_06585 [Micrococcales bacterium]|nr:hypothetical protein [Micrococcales bacterium]
MLREPQKGQPVTADWAREVVRAVRRNTVIAGEGLRIFSGDAGTTVSLMPQRRQPGAAAPAGGYPRPFDIGVEAGVVRVSNVVWQAGDGVRTGADGQIGLPGSPSVLYALIPTGSGAVGFSYSPGTSGGQFFPLALYRLDVDGSVLLDLRGSQVVMYV